MRGNGVLAEPFAKMMRHALGQTPRVYKNERCAMLHRQSGDAIVDFAPHFVGRHRAELASRNLDGQIEFASMTYLHDDRVALGRSAQKMRDKLDGFLRGGKPDAGQAFARQMVEPFEREREM